jgi:hypothetical protein
MATESTDALIDILSESDRLLGYNKPPDLEVIYVGSYVHRKIPYTKYGISGNMFGHICLRYTYQGKQYITNIHPHGNDHNGDMITIYSPEDYFFNDISPQKGNTHRESFGLRHYNVSKEQIAIIHNYLMHIKNTGQFSIGIDLITNILKKWHLLGTETLEKGNCALWTSHALKIANLVDNKTTFPKKIIINDLERNMPDTYLVHYKKQTDNGTPIELANLTLTTSLFYGKLSKYAKLTIDFDNINSTNPRFILNENYVKPNKTRYWTSNASIYIVPVACATYIYKKPPKFLTNLTKLLHFFKK